MSGGYLVGTDSFIAAASSAIDKALGWPNPAVKTLRQEDTIPHPTTPGSFVYHVADAHVQYLPAGYAVQLQTLAAVKLLGFFPAVTP